MPNTHTTLTSLFDDIADAIRAKTGSSADIVADTFPTAIAAIPSGGKTEAEEKDINFYDYDGFRCASWTLAELASKTALPSNPDHSADEVPLTFDGWNWSLADLKTVNRQMNVGAMYHPTDGAIHLILDVAEGRLSPVIGIGIDGSAVIDWDDGSTDSISGTSAGTRIDTAHTYANGGKYHCKITPDGNATMRITGDTTNGSFFVWSGTSGTATSRKYQASVKELYLPSGVQMFSACLYGFAALDKLVLPSNLTGVSSRMLFFNYSLSYVTIPSNVTTFDTYAMYSCTALKNIALPKGMPAINSSAFAYCYALSGLTMPPNITAYGGGVFNGALLYDVTIPSGVTDIGASAFANCIALGWIKFLGSTPPTVANANAWTALPTNCKILVPYSADHSVLNTYKTAANYPDPTVYTYEEY